jgi:hypothetical protein
VRAYLAEHGHKVGAQGAGFENEATGVYWTFSFGDGVAFNLNYYRSHIFGLEAERMLTAMVGELGLAVDDPQSDGMRQGPYTPEGFLRGWNRGNQFAHTAIARTDPKRPLALPAARNAAMWRWNYAKAAFFDELMELVGEVPPCFVPTVRTLLVEGRAGVQRIVTWDLDMAIAIPEVDLVVSMQDGALVAAPWRDVMLLLEPQTHWDADRPVGTLPIGMETDLFDQTPKRLEQKLRALMQPIEATRVAADAIHDAELVAEAFA